MIGYEISDERFATEIEKGIKPIVISREHVPTKLKVYFQQGFFHHSYLSIEITHDGFTRKYAYKLLNDEDYHHKPIRKLSDEMIKTIINDCKEFAQQYFADRLVEN